jgi:hypothetical protein
MPFVADGRDRAVMGARLTLRERREMVDAAMSEQFAPRLARAGLIRRIWLRLRLRFEVCRQMRREKEKIAPSAALYLATTEPTEH